MYELEEEGSLTRLQTRKYHIFYCYAREDKNLRDQLNKHLSSVIRQEYTISWHDNDILAGNKWEDEINNQLEDADFILLLISPDFMHSDYCYSKEMKRALKRHELQEAHVIPIILRPVAWKGTPIENLQVLPSEGKPVTQWRNRDAAFLQIVEGIQKVINSVRERDESLLNKAKELALKHGKLSVPLLQQELNVSGQQSNQILTILKKYKIIDNNYYLRSEKNTIEKQSARQSKYVQLSLWLQNQPQHVKSISLSIQDVEEIIGTTLPPTAYTHGAFWSNNLERNPQARQWCKAGWEVRSVSISRGKILFSRIEDTSVPS